MSVQRCLASGAAAATVVLGAVLAQGQTTGLADAVKARDVRRAAELIKRGAAVDAPQPDGTTALHWAAHWADLDLVDRLLGRGAKVDAANRYGVTPLAVAANAGSVLVMERLLRAGADPNTKSGEGETVLMTAARAGDTAAVRLLLAQGADLHAQEGWRGQNALMWAVLENHADTVEALLEAGADVHAKSKGGFTALLFAARAGRLALARRLIDAGATPGDTLPDGTSALVLATLNAHFELGAMLLERGADPNADGQGWTALHQLAITRSPHHDNVNPQPIPTGSLDSLEFIRVLQAHGADLDRRAKRSPTDRFRQWIDRAGATAFFLAAKAADVPMMRLLVELGADPRIPTNKNITPLAAAAGVGYCQGESPGTEAEALAAVKYTLELGGDVNAIDDDGFTPMHGAATRGANAIIMFLVDQGARLDVRSKEEQWLPLTMAEGVMLANTFKRQLHSAELLRKLMGSATP